MRDFIPPLAGLLQFGLIGAVVSLLQYIPVHQQMLYVAVCGIIISVFAFVQGAIIAKLDIRD
jgi:VIT1/CCC1 family predicted Fe2+/Mn2+ transporter